MKDIKVLTTGAGAPGARGIFKGLRLGAKSENRGMEIITCDMDKDAYGFYLSDRPFVIPPAKSPEFIEEILRAVEKEKPDLLFSWITPELVPLAKVRDKIEALGTKLVLSDVEAITTAQNKAKCFDAISDLGYAPRFKLVNTIENLELVARELGYPEKSVCYKPEVAHGSRGFRIMKPGINRAELLFKEKPNNVFTTLEETKEILKGYQLPNMLVMEHLQGNGGVEYSVDLLLKDGESVITIPRERAKTKGGLSNIARLEKNEELIEASEKIAKKIGLNYNINMQFMFNEEGKPKLIEINPRLSGTVIACVGAGANLPYLAAKIALGEEIQKPEVRWGTVMKRFWEEVYICDKDEWCLGI